jgi:hypothetical protein
MSARWGLVKTAVSRCSIKGRQSKWSGKSTRQLFQVIPWIRTTTGAQNVQRGNPLARTRHRHRLQLSRIVCGSCFERSLRKRTILERDPVNDYPERRKAQPHTRDVHGSLGLRIMKQLFPRLDQTLIESGAMAIVADVGEAIRWCHFGDH